MSGPFRTPGRAVGDVDVPPHATDPHRAWLLGNHDWHYTDFDWHEEAKCPSRVAWIVGGYAVEVRAVFNDGREVSSALSHAYLTIAAPRLGATSRIAVADRGGAGAWILDDRPEGAAPAWRLTPSFDANGLQRAPGSFDPRTSLGLGANTRTIRDRVAALVTNFALAYQQIAAFTNR